METIAHLARLHLEPAETEDVTNSITNILALINEMQSVNTDNVLPLAHAFESHQRLREDVVTEVNQRDELQVLAPSVEKGLFLVPKVIE
ncbi:MAG: Asp-tRNA(Asn)/Glu-tRNA(Gln) amidotransferase subunit GatC [Pseudohongiellaceae bacterium]